jgi:hypothetical protein
LLDTHSFSAYVAGSSTGSTSAESWYDSGYDDNVLAVTGTESSTGCSYSFIDTDSNGFEYVLDEVITGGSGMNYDLTIVASSMTEESGTASGSPDPYSFISWTTESYSETDSGASTGTLGEVNDFSFEFNSSDGYEYTLTGPPAGTITDVNTTSTSTSGGDPQSSSNGTLIPAYWDTYAPALATSMGSSSVNAPVQDGTTLGEWDTSQGLVSAIGGQDMHALQFTGSEIQPAISGSAVVLEQGGGGSSIWASHPSAIGYRRQGYANTGSHGGSGSGANITIDAVAPEFDSGMNIGTDGEEMERLTNFNQGAEENPTVAQEQPTSRAMQQTGGPNVTAVSASAGNQSDGYYHFDDPLAEFIGNNPIYDPFLNFFQYMNGTNGGGGGGGGNGPIGKSPFSNQMGLASPGRSPGEPVPGPPPPKPGPPPASPDPGQPPGAGPVTTDNGGDDDDSDGDSDGGQGATRTPLDDALDQGAAAVQGALGGLGDAALGAVGAFDQLDRSVGSPVEQATNLFDGFVAGIANMVSGGATNQAREALYGETATNNQQGAVYQTGQVVGFGINLVLSTVNPCSASGLVSTGVRALSLLQGASSAQDAYNRYQAGDYAGAAMSAIDALTSLANFGRTCFAAGTPLLTPDGSKYIEDFRIGDLILSRDESDHEAPVVVRRVVNLFQNYSPLLNLRVAGRVIRTTAEHPFWVVGRGWVAAHQIEVGDVLIGANGEQTEVESIEGPSEPATVYNLAVEDYHTYLVGSALWGFSVWAHNANNYPVAPSDPPSRYSGRYADGQRAYRTNVPRDGFNTPLPDPGATGPHTRLQPDRVNPNRAYSGTEFDASGSAVGRIDLSGRPGEPLPHWHPYNPNNQSFGPKQPMP